MQAKEIGDLIKKRREFLNLRQEDLAELSKVTIKTIHLIELGKGNPSFLTLSKLSEVLCLELVLQIKMIK
jgi:transcriptional regulator with XRE-family HTH domain